jgi:hypothetical protein
MPWYRPDEYARLREGMSDPHAMAPTYEAWRMAAEHNEQVAKDAGIGVVRVFIEYERFSFWCAERDLALDGAARMKFVNEAVQGGQTEE